MTDFSRSYLPSKNVSDDNCLLENITNIKCAKCQRIKKIMWKCVLCKDAFYCTKFCQMNDYIAHREACMKRR